MISARHYAIPLTILVALVLQITPLPIQMAKYRPDWLLIVLAYWTMALPHRVNVGVAFIAGVMTDILLGTVMGVHSLALSISIYVLAANYQRLRNYTVWQQCIIITLVSSLYHLLLYWAQQFLMDITFSMVTLWPVVTSTILWPWVFWLLRKTRRQLRIT